MEQTDVGDEGNDIDAEEPDVGAAEGEELLFDGDGEARLDAGETSLDSSAHHILTSVLDPVVWKTELERVGPRLRAQQQLSTNEWRAHVDQTVSSKEQIDKVLGDTQANLQIMNK